MGTDPSGNLSLGELSTTIKVSFAIGVAVGFAVPIIRGPGDHFDDATYSELFVKCLYRNGGAIAIAVVGIAIGIDWGGEPLPKIGDELRGVGKGSSTNITTRLSRLQLRFNTWYKNYFSLKNRPSFRALRFAGRLASAVRNTTNAVGAFTAGYVSGLIPGCAVSAHLHRD